MEQEGKLGVQAKSLPIGFVHIVNQERQVHDSSNPILSLPRYNLRVYCVQSIDSFAMP